VTVNGVTIAHDAISREAQNHPASKPIDAWRAATRALVVRELLLQEARRIGLCPTPLVDDEGRRETDEEASIRGLIDTQVTTPEADAASCTRYYEHNRHRFRSADIYEVSHILISARLDRVDAYQAARERALTLLSHLQAGAHRFAELAKANSDCPSAASGGNLGQLMAGDTTPEFEKALLALKPGEVSGAPVETRYGLHIVRLDRHVPGKELSFEAVHEQIAQYLVERSRRLAIAQYLAHLTSAAEISGVDLPTPSSLRVH
jgi:peptidyl-prolyl cis-trans isomerase C